MQFGGKPAVPEPALAPEERRSKVEELQTALARAYELILELEGDQKPQKLLDSTLESLEKERKQLGDTDAILFYDVGICDKNGVASRICGRNVLHYFTDQKHIAESPRNMEAVLYAALFRPIKSEGDKYLNRFVSNMNPLKGSPAFGNHEKHPTIPDSRPNGFITTAGET